LIFQENVISNQNFYFNNTFHFFDKISLFSLSLSSLADARAYRKVGYRYDTLLNPIARIYFQRQRNTAFRSVIPAEEQPVKLNELALVQKTPSRVSFFNL
jgi:hypothetical protein